jgi:hypothetical protein
VQLLVSGAIELQRVEKDATISGGLPENVDLVIVVAG